MRISKSIRNKLFLLMIIIGALPVVIVVAVVANNMVADLEDLSLRNSKTRNSIVSAQATEFIEKNFYVLYTLALNPEIINYLESSNENFNADVYGILTETNKIFKDNNLMVLTDKNANQLIRTDNSELVNIKNRRHYEEAMQGRDFVSDVILSMSTGEIIVVVEVPVKNSDNQTIGMLQRNLNLADLQYFIKNQDSEQLYVIILDRKGKTIASSHESIDLVKESQSEGTYKYIAEKINNESGIIYTAVNDEDAIVSYSKNLLTGWTIITVQPQKYILNQVYKTIFQAISICLCILIVIMATAYLMAVEVTKPIIEIKNVANDIVKGKNTVGKIEIKSEDEIGQMAEAFNKIRSSRDAYQLESELDKLTKLYNKTTTENICKMKLKNFMEQEPHESLMALYIIDLDNFKKMNDTKGHQFGDKILVEFAKVLRKQFRPNDCIGRFGGDEFVVIIDNLPHMGIITRKAEQIKQAACNLTVEGVPAGITASTGIAIVPNHGTDYETLFKIADESLYYVKAHGRNGYHYSDENID